MKIGELAQLTNTQPETVRFYERQGLLPKAQRTDSNYRIYDQSHAERLSFIRHCRTLDMTLDEIRVLLDFRDMPQQSCATVNDLLDEHIGHVAQRIQELSRLDKHLKRLRAQCVDGRNASDCGILSELANESRKDPAAEPRDVGHIYGAHNPGNHSRRIRSRPKPASSR